MSYKLTQDIKDQINIIANSNLLPSVPMEYMGTIHWNGTDLLKKGISEMEINKIIVKIEYGKTYKQSNIPMLKNLDHAPHLRSAYRNKGIAALMTYAVKMIDYKQRAMLMYPSLFDDEGNYKGVDTGTVMKPDTSFVEYMNEQKAAQKNSILKKV